jgi:hypothetical protein
MIIEEGVLQSGLSCKLAYINLSKIPKLSVQAGDFKWSQPRNINVDKAYRMNVDLQYRKEDIPGLVLTLTVKEGRSKR